MAITDYSRAFVRFEPYGFGGKLYSECFREELERFVRQEDEFTHRCKLDTCRKLFKTTSFWKRHAYYRHRELLLKMKDEVRSSFLLYS